MAAIHGISGTRDMHAPIAIVAARRTPIGSFQGQFNNVPATRLGADAVRAALADSGVPPGDVDELFMGCVLPAGLGQAPARQAALGAGLPDHVGCVTVNKVCGSGMKTMMLAADLINAGSAWVVVAGGMENMSAAPYLLPMARSGYRMGHGEVIDHMFFDGLQNPYDRQMMGHFAEQCVDRYQFTREAQDAYAAESVRRALRAMESGAFAEEIVPVTVPGRGGDVVVDADEEPPTCNIDRIPTLKPAFRRDGTVTAANASKISDGAAATVLTSIAYAQQNQLPVLGRLVAHAGHAQAPEWFTTAPGGAIRRVLERAGWQAADVDLYEINEAFAAVAMAAMHDLELDHARVNVRGGACALGHPIGASGTRIAITLLHALRAAGKRRGIASLCIGGGEAVAIAVEVD
jgi:acetyl-CoA C-acetyltransferase